MKEKIINIALPSVPEGTWDDIEFPIKVVARREDSDEILTQIYLPSSGPDIKCHVTRTLGKGNYVMTFVMADGTENSPRKLIVDDDSKECPFLGHCAK